MYEQYRRYIAEQAIAENHEKARRRRIAKAIRQERKAKAIKPEREHRGQRSRRPAPARAER